MTNTCTDCIYEPLPDIAEPCHSCEYYSRWTPKTDVEPTPKTEAKPEALTRESVLNSAKEIVLGGRDAEYGGPEDSFKTIAKLWASYRGEFYSTTDVALMLALLKVARLKTNPMHRDSWIDLAGYAACGGECSGRE